MKTRSNVTVDSVLKRKTVGVPSNRDLSKITAPEVVKTPNDKERKIRTPLSKRRSITPRGDDLICSQHFDSQVVVGWDCHSPDSLRDLKKFASDDDPADLITRLINNESDDVTIPKRSTPPLLGLWREAEKEESQKMHRNALMPNRIRKRGRVRRKSGKDSVSQALLQKLEKALDKCSETNKDTEPRTAEGELFPSDCEEEGEADIEDEAGAANTSADLFDTNSNTDTRLQDNTDSASAGARQEAEWSDDELFQDESFMVKPTQLATESKKSQVFGLKRKPFRDTDLPQSKCFRVSERQTVGRLGQQLAQPSNTGVSGLSRFTAISAKSSRTVVDNKASTATANAHTRTMQFPIKPTPYSRVSSNVRPGGNCSTVSAVQTTRVSSCNPVVATATQSSARFYGTGKASTNLVTQSKPTSVINPSMMNRDGYKLASLGTGCQTGVQSHSLHSVTGSLQTLNQTTQNRASAFKKHSSFSGTESVNQSRVRKRSISGNSNTTIWSGSPANSRVEPCVAKTDSNHSAHTTSSSFHEKSKASCNPKTFTSSSSSIQIVNSKNIVKEIKTRISSTAFDTSISDDLLCLLAEPDDILDSQINFTKPVTPSNASVGRVNGSLNANSNVLIKSTYCATTTALKSSHQTESKAAKAYPGAAGSAVPGGGKQYRFRDSQKLTVATKCPPQPPVNIPGALSKAAEDSDGGNTAQRRMEMLAEEALLDGFSDDAFEDEFSDDEGLTEPQILAMLEEAEFLATQQSVNASQKVNQDPFTNSQGLIFDSQGQPSYSQDNLPDDHEEISNRQGHISNSQGHVNNNQGQLTDCQGQVSASQGQVSASQGQVSASQGQMSASQGQVSASQARYTAEEIERKKREAIQKRKLKSQLRNTQAL